MIQILILIFLSIKLSFAEIVPLSQNMIQKLHEYQIFKDSCSEVQKNLVEVKVSYYNLKGEFKTDGSIIVHKVVAESVESVFKKLLEIKFPIHGVDPFKGGVLTKNGFIPDDDYNYSGSFYCRNIQSSSKIPSVHSIGMAIDINPLYNPYIEISKNTKSIAQIIPKDGVFYLNRDTKRDKKAIINQKVVEIFAKNGFNIWGGNWDNPIDYHHFQLSGKFAFLLTSMDEGDAKALFRKHIEFYNAHKSEIIEEIFKKHQTQDVKDLIQKYKQNPHEL